MCLYLCPTHVGKLKLQVTSFRFCCAALNCHPPLTKTMAPLQQHEGLQPGINYDSSVSRQTASQQRLSAFWLLSATHVMVSGNSTYLCSPSAGHEPLGGLRSGGTLSAGTRRQKTGEEGWKNVLVLLCYDTIILPTVLLSGTATPPPQKYPPTEP